MRITRLVLLAAAAGTPAALAQPAALENAKVTVVAAEAGGFARQIRGLAAGGPARWIGWAAPAEDPRRRMCCGGDWSRGKHRGSCCGTCRLEREESTFWNDDGGGPARLEPPRDFWIFARAEAGKIDTVRHFSGDCPIDAGGMPVVWISDVRVDESVAWLNALAGGRDAGDGSPDPDPAEEALAALAQHAGPAAQAALIARLAHGQPEGVREKAVFWLASSRGAAGCAAVRGAVPADRDGDFREQGTFALSLCEDHGGVETLLQMARRDEAGDVRGQALFWLAQRAGEKAAAAIDGAIRDDPDTEVKKRAVFALTQMPDGQGVTELIRVARTNRNPEVREQAVFWLGQSKDPRALDFIEQVLTK